MIICVPTIQHTGTHLLRRELLREETRHSDGPFWFKNTGIWNSNPEPWTIIGDHIYDQTMDMWEERFKQFPIITTLRHPVRCLKSFLSRGTSIRLFNQQWRCMIECVAPYDPMYLHIDHPVRDKELQRISEFIGKDIETTWPIGSSSGCFMGNHDASIETDPRISQEFIDFYYETIQNVDSNTVYNAHWYKTP